MEFNYLDYSIVCCKEGGYACKKVTHGYLKRMTLFKNIIRPSLLIGLLVILIGSFYYLFFSEQTNVQSDPIQTSQQQDSTEHIENDPPAATEPFNDNEPKNNFDFAALDLKLLAAIVANPINQSTAVIQANDLVTLYKLNDKIKQTELSIAAIYQNYIVLVLDDQEYELRLSAKQNPDIAPAIFDETEVDPEQTAMNNQLANEIGNRPKELEHIVAITPGTNGFYVTPGINPALFRAAKFKEGDVLQTINGKDVNIPEELDQAKSLIARAETLEFNVLRDGVLITLYLDIPAQDLSISR